MILSSSSLSDLVLVDVMKVNRYTSRTSRRLSNWRMSGRSVWDVPRRVHSEHLIFLVSPVLQVVLCETSMRCTLSGVNMVIFDLDNDGRKGRSY